MTDQDYGTLLCWANNTIGFQENPCVFHIVAADKPEPPHNCRVFDVTISSLQVACLAGDDGGITQNFLLKVYQIGSSSPVVELRRSSPTFSVVGLRPATAYKIIMASLNDKGISKDAEIKAYTIRVPDTQEKTNAEPTRDRGRGTGIPLALTVGGTMGLLLFILMVLGVAVALKTTRTLRLRRRDSPAEGGGTEQEDEAEEVGRTVKTPAEQGKDETIMSISQETSIADERNPDIISHAPDPAQLPNDREIKMSTVAPTSSSCLLPNEARNHSATDKSQAKLLALDHILCSGPPAPQAHIHDTTCLSTSAYSHNCHPSAVMPQVPYLVGFQQRKVAETALPHPANFCQGCNMVRDAPPLSIDTSYNPCISTLGRRKSYHSYIQPLCPHFQHLQYMPCGSAQQVLLASLLHQDTPSAVQTACELQGRAYYGSQYNLFKFQRAHGASKLAVNDPSSSPLDGKKCETKESVCLQGSFQRKCSKKKSQNNDIMWSPPSEQHVCSSQSGESVLKTVSVISPSTLRKSETESSV